MPATFALTRYGRLLLCSTEAAGPTGKRNVTLLIDTGSNYTIVPVEVLEKIGCRPARGVDYLRILTGNGVIVAPRIRLQALAVFGKRLEDAEVVAHDIPFNGPIDGLLGMDVLGALQARIDIGAGTIELP